MPRLPQTLSARLLASVLFFQPGIGADLGAADQRAVPFGVLERRVERQEHLACEVGTQPTVFQAPIHSATAKHSAVAPLGQAQLIGASLAVRVCFRTVLAVLAARRGPPSAILHDSPSDYTRIISL